MKNYLQTIGLHRAVAVRRAITVLLLLLAGFMQPGLVKASDFLVMGWSNINYSNNLSLVGTGGSAVVTIKWSGWYLETGSHSTNNPNYICGFYYNQYYRNWFAFDIPTGLGTITSATLNVVQYGGIPSSGYVTIQFYDVTTPYATVNTNYSGGSATGQAIFADLGTGAYFGNGLIDNSLPQSNMVSLPLNAAARGSIQNAAGTTWMVAGRADNISPTLPPDAVTNSATNVTGSSATFNGSVNANGTSTATYFRYGTVSGSLGTEVTASPATVTGSSATAISYNVTGLAAGTTYYYQVKAYAASISSTVYGLEKSFTTANSTPPAPPSSISVSANPICNGGGTTLTANGPVGTVYWYSGGTCGGTSIGQGNTLTVYPTTTTTYSAMNYNNSLFSTCTASASVVVNNPATVPATATCGSVTNTTAALSWGTSTATGAITYYWVVGTSSSVTYGTVGVAGVAAQGTTSAPTTTATATGLSPSTTYYLRVYATTAAPCGNSAYQTSTAFTTVPTAPVASGATLIRANSFTANWATTTGATAYFLDVSTNLNFGSFLTGYNNRNVGNVTSLGLTGLNRETTYYYRVRGYNTGGYSLYSPTITVLTLPVSNFLIENPSGGNVTDQTAGIAFSVKITARDAFNTTVTDYTGNATLTTNSVISTGATTANFAAGVLSSTTLTLTLAGTMKTITATSGPVSTASNTFTVLPAAINYFGLVANGPVTAGTPFTVTVTVYDVYNNVKTNYSGAHSVTWTTTATTSLSGQGRIIPTDGDQTFTNGVATIGGSIIGGFTFYNSMETPTITITDAPTSSPGTTAPITILDAGLDNFKVVAGVTQQTGVPFDVTVTARDIYWNTCIYYVGNVRFKSSNDAVVVFPAGLQPFIPGDHGVRVFSGGVTINAIGAYWVRAADGVFAYKSGQQENIVVGPGPFSKLVANSTLTIAPGENHPAIDDPIYRVAGQYVFVTATPRDALGNLMYACRDISILLNGQPTDNTGPIVVTNVGDGSYTATVRATLSGTNTISARYNTTMTLFDQTRTVIVTPAPIDLAHTTITASPTTMTTDETSSITVQLKDQFNNNRTTSDGTVALATTKGWLSAVVDNGNGTYSSTLHGNYGALGTAHITGNFTGNSLNLTINGPFSNSADVVINEGLPALATIDISANPTVITTNQTSLISVQLKDQFGNLVTTNRGTVTLASDKGALTAVAYTSGGIYTSTLSGWNPGFGTATITGKYNGGDIADNATVTFNPGKPDLAHITVSANPITMTSDESSVITVQLKDVYDNIITTSRGTITLSSNKGALTSVTDHADGTYTATLTGDNRGFGTATITAHLVDAPDVINGDATHHATVTITEGKPNLAHIDISPSVSTMTSDQTALITVQLKDQFGNNLSASRGTITLGTTLGALTSVTDHSNGTYTATLSANISGFGLATITGSLTDTPDAVTGAITDNALVTITEGKPNLAHIQITASPLSITTDEFSTVSIQLQDQWGNNLSTSRGIVTLLSDKGLVTGTATYTSAGIYTGTLTGDNRGVGLATITGHLLDSGDAINGDITDNAQVTITEGLPSLATSTVTANPVTMTTDGSSTITVQLKDQHGNLIINDRGTVTLVSTIGLLSGVTYAGSGTYTATLQGDTRGTHGTGLSTITANLVGTGTASAVAGDLAHTATVNITEGLPALATTIITASPTTMTTDDHSTITVQLKDALGNLIVNDRSTVALSTTKGVLGSVSYAGLGTYTAILSGNSSGTGLATITGTLAGVVAGTITDDATVLITEGAPALAVTTISASPLTMTTDESSAITVQLKDQFGNNLTTSRGTITLYTDLGVLTTVTDHTNGTYTATLTANFTGTGYAHITGQLNGSSITSSPTVHITEGKPNLAHIDISASLYTMTSDQTSIITVQLKDQWGNNLTSSRGTIALSTNLGALTSVTDHANGTYTATLSANNTGFGPATVTGSLTDTPDAVTGAITDNAVVTITEGKPDLAHIQITASPLSITTDETSTITIQLEDQWGNLLTTQRGTVTLTSGKGLVSGTATYVSGGQYTGTLTGDSRGTGLATITGHLADGVEVNGNITDNAQVTITEGLPSLAHSTVTASPTSMTTDGSSTITVQLKDQYNNNILNDRGTVTMVSTIGLLSAVSYTVNGIYTATLHGDTRGTNGVGLSTITAHLVGTGSAIGVAGDFGSTTTVDIQEGLPALATTDISASPITMTTDDHSTITVQLKDQWGNLITHDRSIVALHTTLGVLGTVSYTGPGVYTATLSGSTPGTGTATITGTLTGTPTGAITDNATVTITDGAPSLTTSTITANPITITTDGSSTITVQLKDQFGNNLTTSRGTITLLTSLGVLTGVTDHSNGTYTATLTGSNPGVGTATITGKLDGSSLIHFATVSITEGAPSLTVSTITASPTSITTDGSSTVTVQLKDQWGNLITHSRGTVTLFTSKGVLTAVTDHSNGTYTAVLTANATGTGTANISGKLDGSDFATGTSVLITEGLPVLARIDISASPTAITADQTSTITVRLEDQWGNFLTTSRGTVALATSPIGHLGTVTDHGDGTYTATFSLTAYGTGVATITGTFTGTGNAVGVNGAITHSATVTVSPGAATKLTILTQPSASATAGIAFVQQPVVRIEDQWGNLTTDTRPVTAARSAGTSILHGTTTVNAVGGVATFTDLSYNKAETITLLFTSNPALATATSSNIVVGPNVAAYFAVTGNATQIAGSSQTITITAYDAYDNVATGYTGAKTGVFITGASPSNAPVNNPTFASTAFGTGQTVTFSSGVATGSMILFKTEVAQINVDDGTRNASLHKLSVTVGPTVLKDMLVYGVGNPHDLGTWQTVTVEPRDSYNNRKTNYVGKITFSNTDVLATNPADYQYVLADNGIHTFTSGVLFGHTGSWWLTALDLAEPTKYGAQANIIVQRAVTITANNRSKTYGDVMTLGAMLISTCTVTGIVPGVDPVAGDITGITLASPGAAATATVAGSTYPITPSLATGPYNPAYYRIVYSTAGQLTVNKRDLTLSNFLANNKTYDGTTSVTGDGFSDNRVNSDVLTFSYSVAFATKHAGPSKLVNYTGIAISGGAGAGNYTLVTTSGTTTAAIYVRAINVTAQTDNKVYDGTNSSAVLPVVDALQTGDLVTSRGIQTYNNRNVGTSKVLTPANAVINDGNSGNNYAITYVTNGTGIITRATVTVTAQHDNRVYNRLVTSSVAPVVTGIISPDVASTSPAQVYNSKDVGTGKTLTASGLVINDGFSGGNYTINYVADNTGIITTAPVTVTAHTDSKIYDGTTSSSVAPTVSGIIAADYASTLPHQTYDNRNVGTGKTMAASGLVIFDGFGGNDYAITYVDDHTGVITTAAVTVTANHDTRIYNGTTSSSVAPTVTGIIGPDVASTNPTQTFDTRHVGTLKTLTAAGLVINDGNSGNNYAVSYVANHTGIINTAAVSVTAQTDNRIYNGTTSSSVAPVVVGILSPDVVGTAPVQTYDTRFVGTNKTLTAIGLVINDGNLGNDYSVTYYTNATGVITTKSVTVTAQTDNKVYDRSVASSVAPVVTGIVSPDAVGTAPHQTYDNWNVGTAKTMTATGLVISDAFSGGNYSISYVQDHTGVITTAGVTVTAHADSRIYNGTTSSSVAPTVSGIISGDAVGTAPVQTYDTRHVGTGKTMTAAGLVITDGNSGNNYSISYVENFSGVITTAAVSVTAQHDTRIYNGTTSSSVAPVVAGILSPDVVGTAPVQTYDTRHVGTLKTLSATGLVISDGNGGNDYAVTYYTNTTGVITTKAVSVTAQTDNKVYDRSVSSAVAPVVVGIVSPDVVGTAPVQTYDNWNVGTGKTMTAAGLAISDGNSGNDYAVTYYTNTTGIITWKPITGNFTVTSTKVYDGNSLANVLTRTLNGVISGDDAYLSGGIANYNNKNVGTGKTVTLTGYSLLGTTAPNYNLTGVFTTTADITVRTLTLSNFAADNKVYDGTLVATGLGFNDDRVSGDNLAFTRDAAFDNKNVGTSRTVLYTNIVISGGTDKDNYVLASTTGNTGANRVISARGLTIYANSVSKPYGTAITGASGSTAFTSAGLQNGETIGTVTIAYGAGSAALDPVATYTGSVTATAATGGTFTAGNYSITYSAGDITVYNSSSVSGHITYYNAGNTPMNNVTVELWQGGSKVYPATGTVATDAQGYYTFPNVLSGTYDVHFTTVKLTYSGTYPFISGAINATDAALTNQYANGILPGNVWPAIEKVKLIGCDITAAGSIQAVDPSMMLAYFTNSWTTWVGHVTSPRPDWTFWKPETTTHNNITDGPYPQITIVPSTNLTQDFYALVTGDFNQSFTPGGAKSANANLRLEYGQTVKASLGDIIELPVYATSSMELGAVSLILNFPSDKLEVLGVAMNSNASSQAVFNAINDELRIGWTSLTPLNLNAGEKLLTMRVRVIGSIAKDETLRFTLSSNPLNELDDASVKEIGDAVLSMDVLGSSTLGITDPGASGNIRLANYPNPFAATTTLAYTLPVAGDVTIEIRNMLGSVVQTVVNNEAQQAGDYKLRMDASILEPGVYTATLKLNTGSTTLTRTIKIVRTR